MSEVKMPLMSEKASGKFGDELVVKYQAEAGLEYYLIVSQGRFNDWAGGDTLTGIDEFDGLIQRVG